MIQGNPNGAMSLEAGAAPGPLEPDPAVNAATGDDGAGHPGDEPTTTDDSPSEKPDPAAELASLKAEADQLRAQVTSFAELAKHPNGVEIFKQYRDGLGIKGADQGSATPAFSFKIDEGDLPSPEARGTFETVLNKALTTLQKQERTAADERFRALEERLAKYERQGAASEWDAQTKQYGNWIEKHRAQIEKLRGQGLSWSQAVNAATEGRAALELAKRGGAKPNQAAIPTLQNGRGANGAKPTVQFRRNMGLADFMAANPGLRRDV